jgi:hypothetical protein
MGVRQAPLPALQSIGRGQIDAIADEGIAHVARKRLRTTERVFRLWRGAPQIVLPEIFGLIITNDQQHIGFLGMQALPQHRKRVHDVLLIHDVLTEPVVLPEFLQELRYFSTHCCAWKVAP